LILPPLMGTRMQDGWRHHFFIYPLLSVFALFAVQSVWEITARLSPLWLGQCIRAALMVSLAISIGVTAAFMIRHHPFQFVYGSALSGDGFRRARCDCTLDEWGVSYRAALERIARADARETVRVHFANRPGFTSLRILSADDRRRFRAVVDEREADYYLTNLRNNCSGHAMLGDEWFALSVAGSKFMVVTKVSR
jgi:hypothetical protein